MTTYTISDTPVQVQQDVASGWTLQNVGANPIYLGNDRSVTSANGYIVLPGVAIPIQAGTVLYAVCASGLPSSVSTVQGVQAPTVSNVEVNGPVTVSGDVNVTNASIPVSGTVDAIITNATVPVSGTVNANITSGSVAISGTVNATINSGTVNVGNTVTTQGASAVIVQSTRSSLTSVTIGSFSGLAPYGTLSVNINRNNPGGAATGTCNILQFQWTDASGNNIYTDQIVCSATGSVQALIPVVAPNMTLAWVAGGSGPTSIPVTVIGLPEVLPRRVFHLYGNTSQSSGCTILSSGFDLTRGFTSWSWNTVNGSFPSIFLGSRGGACRIGFSNFDAGGAHQILINDAHSGQTILRHTTAANTSDFELSAMLPEGPLILTTNLAATAVYQQSVTIAWDPS